MRIGAIGGLTPLKYYLNTYTVGEKGYNLDRADVQLVQFFIYHFYQSNPE